MDLPISPIQKCNLPLNDILIKKLLTKVTLLSLSCIIPESFKPWGACDSMRSKTRQQLCNVAWRWQRWRLNFGWLVVGPHGLQCSTCQKAGLDTPWSRGEGYCDPIIVSFSGSTI